MSRSLVSLVYTKFEQGPFSFIELLVYAVVLLTFTFLLSFRLGYTACKSKGLRCSGTGSSTLKIISAWPQAKGDMQ